MARPVRKSPPIQFRFEIDDWPEVERLAAAKDLTPSEWVKAQIVRSLEAKKAQVGA